ncbi:MAG: hypothetical protein CM15mP128_4710 [Methanobacteriota archaeon]|nr:MAG: hypothetical protein CM15mP128_4710 [Euryarchaeota archaeon]
MAVVVWSWLFAAYGSLGWDTGMFYISLGSAAPLLTEPWCFPTSLGLKNTGWRSSLASSWRFRCAFSPSCPRRSSSDEAGRGCATGWAQACRGAPLVSIGCSQKEVLKGVQRGVNRIGVLLRP